MTNKPTEQEYQQQKNRKKTPSPRNLFTVGTSPPRSPTLARIGEAANQPTGTPKTQKTPPTQQQMVEPDGN
jgi:hypothetical protein